MPRPPRIVFLTLILGGLALWIVLDSRVRDSTTPTRASALPTLAENATSAAPALSGVSARILVRRALSPLREDPFTARSWNAPQAKPARVARRAAPVAPPLPFRFVGRVYEDASTKLYLARGDKLYSVSKGDTLDGQYLVESVSDTSITFLYRPSGTRQVMRLTPPLDGSAADKGG